MRRPKTAGRRMAVLALGFVFILAGLAVFVFSGEIASRIESALQSSGTNPGNVTQLGPSGAWYLPYAVFGFGFSLIGIGAGLIRTVFHTSVHSFMTGGSGGGPAGSGDPQAFLESFAGSAILRNQEFRGAATGERTVVKVKCRNCGNLEPEDAAFCRKCGQSL